MKKILVIIQARMGSTRLPGKIIKPLYGRSLILHLIDNLKMSKHEIDILVATSTNPENDKLVELLDRNGIKYYRGSENDVLSRFEEIISLYMPKIIVRATADDPLMSAECMDILIDRVIEKQLDYAFMKNMPIGTSVEVVKANVLSSLRKKYHLSNLDTEHVTYYITHHSSEFRVEFVEPPEIYCAPEVSLTVDTCQQFIEMEKIYSLYGDKTDLKKAIDYFRLKG